MHVTITGGGGFIGAWLTKRLLARGDRVRLFDLTENRTGVAAIVGADISALEWVQGDVSDGKAVHEAANGSDLLIHLAAVLTPACQADPVRGAEINLIGTLNVFEAARLHRIKKVLYMSSAGVFGHDDGATPFPLTHYGAFKLAGEGSARAYWIDHEIASVGVRPLVVYGPGRETGLTAGPTLACRAAARGESYTIPFSGESNFVYVDDVARAFELAASIPLEGAETHNILGETSTVAGIANTIRDTIANAQIDFSGPILPITAHIADTGIAHLLGGLETTTLADGIAATVKFYREK